MENLEQLSGIDLEFNKKTEVESYSTCLKRGSSLLLVQLLEKGLSFVLGIGFCSNCIC